MKRLLTFAGVLFALSAGAQQDVENVTIEPVPVADGLHMLVEARSRVQALLDEGKTPGEIVAAAPLADLDERWSSGFIDGQGFTRAIVAGLSGS